MFRRVEARPVRRADNFPAISKPIVYAMWDPQHAPTREASTACYGDSFTFAFKHHTMMTSGSRCTASPFLTLALDGEWSASCSGRKYMFL
jgi:hypothetical protein